MGVLRRLQSLGFGDSHVNRDYRSAGNRRASVALESLETRGLMSVPGVSLSYGNLLIQAPSGSSGNVANISIDPANHNVQVSFNGKSEEFCRSSVSNITYMGGSGGHDTFTNNTNLVSLVLAFGSHDTVTGGTGYNYVYFYGGGNTFNAQSGCVSDVSEIGGSDTINSAPHATVNVFVY